MTLSRCLKPDSLSTRGFISSVYGVNTSQTSDCDISTFKVTVIEGYANTVESQTAEKLGVGVRKEIFQKLGQLAWSPPK